MPSSTLLPAVLLLAACTGKADGTCSSDPVDGAVATVDGAAWSAASVTWLPTGDSVHIISADEGSGWFSIVAQLTTEGDAVATAVDAGSFPIEVTLETGLEGGFVTWYSADGESAATTEGGEGTLTLSGSDDAGLSGCLAFTAGPDGGDVELTDGQFTAVPQ